MTQEVKRSYLEINSIQDLEEVPKPSEDYSINLLDPINFQLNKFFYKNIGKKHQWVDRLVWIESKWIDYVSDKKIKTYVFKHGDDLAGFFELIFYFDILLKYLNMIFQPLFFQGEKLIRRSLLNHLYI